MPNKIVIVGAGHAAGQLITTLKQKKFAGEIVLIGDEPYLPYQRPPLSKKFLAGEMPAERLYVKPEHFYDDASIDVRLNTRVERIDRNERSVTLSDDQHVHYDALVLALGSRARKLILEGADLPGVHYLRSIADVEAIRDTLGRSKSVAIIGGGYIGLEVAAVTRKLGLDVTVLEMADRVMSRVVSAEISDFYQIEHSNHGVNLRLSTGVDSIQGDERVTHVKTSSGELITAECVLIGVGVIPNTELAEAAGIAVDNGIVVDSRCRTNDSRIFAIGDCTLHPNEIYDRPLRLESVHNALEQAKAAACAICGEDSHYNQVPWFWSDQYDLKLQIAGLSQGYDRVVIRGNPAERSFACLYLKDGRLIATDAVNSPRDFVQSKALIEKKVSVGDKDLSSTETSLKDLFEQETSA